MVPPFGGSAGIGGSGIAGGTGFSSSSGGRFSVAPGDIGNRRNVEQYHEPFELLLSFHDSDPDVQWNRVEVSLPTLIWPYRDDSKTGTGDLEWLSVQFARRRITATQGFGSTSAGGPGIFPSQRGSCFLWSPGVWWVRVSAGNTGGARLLLGFNAVPMPDPSNLSYFNFSRWTSRGVGVSFQNVEITPGTKILSVQESLDCSAFQVMSVTDSVQVRWELTPDGASEWIARIGPTQGQNLLTFEGPIFPIADMWCEANTGTRNVRTTQYR